MKHLTPQVPYLLAKWRDYDYVTKEHYPVRGFNLAGHVSSCMVMGDYLLNKCRFGRRLFQVMNLGRFTTEADFQRLCLLAILCHDLGKAGHEFQTFLWQLEHLFLAWGKQDIATLGDFKKPWGDDRYRQKYRHEALTTFLLLKTPALWQWLVQESGSEANALLVLSGAFGHHRKTALEKAVKIQEDVKGNPVFLQEATRVISRIAPKFGLGAPPVCPDTVVSPQQIYLTVCDFHNDHKDTDEETPLSAAIKYVTILADVLGSMSPKDQEKIVGYHKVLQTSLDTICGRPDMKPVPIRFRRHLDAKGWEKFRRKLFMFQKRARALGKSEDAILAAACGRGKSVAGYLWAAKRPDLKLIFTTPTTATATQINLDHQLKGKTGVRHSRFGVDEILKREGVWKTGTSLPKQDIGLTSTPEDSALDQAEIDAEYAGLVEDFKGFSYEVTHATVDQVLGVLAYSHRSVMWLLYLVDAQIVFDEFHCYDQTMQKWFTRFLQWFPGIRIMCMSATIADEQRDAVLAARPNAVLIQDDEKDSPAKIPRYRIHVLGSRAEAMQHFKPGTLWIVNQVRISQEVGEEFPEAIVGHSRFGYRNRVEVQQALVEGFRSMDSGEPGPMAVATQIAEISLDISAWPGIFEICDPASGIQRLGRVNRKANPKGVCDVYLYMPENGYPYHPQGSLVAFENLYLPWWKSLEGRDLSQDDLAQAFREYQGHKIPTGEMPFLEMTETRRRPLRQQQTATLGLWIGDLPKDPKEWRKMSMSDLQALEMPLYLTPKERKTLIAQDKWFKYRYILDAPNFHYDKRLGLIKTFNDFEGLVEDGDEG